jgi:hypothetical protein
VRGAPQQVEKDWTAPATLLTERVDPRRCEHGTTELPSMRCGTNYPASCTELRGCSGTYSRRRESHWVGCHRRRPKGEKQGSLVAAGWRAEDKRQWGGQWHGMSFLYACTRGQNGRWRVLARGCAACSTSGARVRAAVEQGRVRLVTGGVSVKETRSYVACLLRLSRRARW